MPFSIRRRNFVVFPSLTAVIIGSGLYIDQSRQDFAEAQIDNFSISIHKKHIHLFLAEFDRWIVLKKQGVKLITYKMFEDTGGTVRIDVYRNPDSSISLIDRFDEYILDLSNITIAKKDAAITPPDLQNRVFLGAFDYQNDLQRRFYSFISAQKNEAAL